MRGPGQRKHKCKKRRFPCSYARVAPVHTFSCACAYACMSGGGGQTTFLTIFYPESAVCQGHLLLVKQFHCENFVKIY